MRLLTTLILLTSVIRLTAQIIEAENGVLSGTQKSTQRSGYSGNGYVTGFDADGDKVTIRVTVGEAGVYNLYFQYASPSGDKFNFVSVNDDNIGSIAFLNSPVFKETKAGKIFLKKGENQIAVVKEWGYFDLDYIRMEPAEASDFNQISKSLVTHNPSFQADSLYRFLSGIYGKVILSGQYGGSDEFDKIKTISGETPVIRGFDLMDYSPSRVAYGATSGEVEKAIEWNKRGGVVTFCWHWNAPKDLINQTGKEWWRGFYADATTFDVTKAMTDQTSEEYKLILRDIDTIAVQLKKLRDKEISVLWRPLHEAEGKWFWWGAKGPDACKWLWKLLFDRLVNHHQLNNLIWVWTSTGNTSALEWYPGDDVVDMIGADIYLPAGTYSSSFITFDNIVSLYGGKKIVALSENGPIPDPEKLFVEGAAWSWFCTWSGNFITDGVSNSTTHIDKVFKHNYVITLDEVHTIDTIVVFLDKKREEINEDTLILDATSKVNAFIRYQNPISGNQFRLEIENRIGPLAVEVYNTSGQLLEKQECDDCQRSMFFNFEGISDGMFLVKVYYNNKVKVLRIIRNR
jgi:mannan endo-1,4-beta-mannosidase